MNTDGRKSEGVATKAAVTQRVKDVFIRNPRSSAFICGSRLLQRIQLPDLGSFEFVKSDEEMKTARAIPHRSRPKTTGFFTKLLRKS
jgi:16S rRNA C967 or C1407 C5-methylase (RsmB/RsmF family)